ncbi:MAG: MFS transporter [Burkholderiales bacterium]|nr:MFS transporter [Burkholderiales bacterium]
MTAPATQTEPAHGAGWLAARVGGPFIAGYFVSYSYRAVNAVLAPTLAEEFGLTAGTLGLLSSVYFLAFMLFQLPGGVLLDRYGPRRVNATLLLVAAAGGLWFAGAGSTLEAIGARALIGLGVSVCLMSTFQAFVLWYPTDRIATMNAIAFSVGVIGAITVSVPLEMLLRVIDWRQAFGLIVALNLAVSALLWLWVPERSARPRGEPLGEQLRGLSALLRESAFLRAAICLGASQFAATALQTLWVATWWRDVAGYTPAEVARGLALINAVMIIGYIGFGRAADRAAQRGASTAPLFMGGIAVASLCLGLIVLGVRSASLVLWCVFVCAATAAVVIYSTLSRRYPKAMSGRVNTGLNVFGFAGMFLGQWAVGIVIGLWPPTATGYAPEAYTWALAMLWLVQFSGLAWFWKGRRLFA